MESNFNNKDFEQFVKQNADQYRMFPSEKVWKGIHNALHTRRRWFGIGLTLLLLTTGTVTWVMVTSPSKNQAAPSRQIISSNTQAKDQKTESAVKSNNILFIPGPDGRQKNGLAANTTVIEKNNLIKGPGIVSINQSETLEEIVPNKPENLVSAIPLYNNEPVYFIPVDITSIGIINDNDPEFESNQSLATTEIKLVEARDMYPLSIESVINSFEYIAKRKLTWQIYFAPTISYRRLSENKAFLSSPQSSNSPYSYAAIYDINTAVTHKPDMGFELGFNAGYPVSPKFKIIGGLQFNVSKYDIRAYTTPTELATIALTNNNGTRSGSVSTPTNYRNFSGYRPNWLHNFYLSASAPFGAELKLKGDNKTYLGIGGTIQPTYILGDRAYMISTDYKNYAEVPQLIRRWNVSSSFETFAGYSTGKINWKIGPQVRYQLLSSFQKKYPVKEHIFDFGLKVGVMLNQ